MPNLNTFPLPTHTHTHTHFLLASACDATQGFISLVEILDCQRQINCQCPGHFMVPLIIICCSWCRASCSCGAAIVIEASLGDRLSGRLLGTLCEETHWSSRSRAPGRPYLPAACVRTLRGSPLVITNSTLPAQIQPEDPWYPATTLEDHDSTLTQVGHSVEVGLE